MSSHPERASAPEMRAGGGLQRRTIVGAAAWAAPALVAATASPAVAASVTPLGTINVVSYPKSIATGQRATVTGWLDPRIATTITLLHTAGKEGLIAPEQVQSDADGSFMFVVEAIGNGISFLMRLTAPGYSTREWKVTRDYSVAGTIEFTSAPAQLRKGEQATVTGKVTAPSGGSRPSSLSLSSSTPTVVSAPPSAAVAGDGTFSFVVKGMSDSGTATIAASATGYSAATFTVEALAAAVPGKIEFTCAPTEVVNGEQVTVTGKVTPPTGKTLPPSVSLSSSASGVVSVPSSAAVAPDGTFSFAASGKADSGQAIIRASATGYDYVGFPITATAKPVGTIHFTSAPSTVANGATGNIRGLLITPAGVSRPGTVSIASSDTGAFTVPATAAVASDGTFSFDATARADSGSATITVTGADHGSAAVTMCATAKPVGTIHFTSKPTAVGKGATGNVRGLLITPLGVVRPSTVSISSSNTKVFTVPGTAKVASDGTFSFDATAKAASGSATITVTGTDHGSASFTVTATAVSAKIVGSVTLTTNAELHPVTSVPLLDESVTFTATVKNTKGAVMAGQDVTFTAPTGTKFSSGSTMTVKTNASGQAKVTLLRQASHTPASTVNVQATAGGVTATMQLIIVGPEVTLRFDVPAVTRHQCWTLYTDRPHNPLWFKNPAKVVASAKDVWSMTGFGELTPGLWTKKPDVLAYGALNPNKYGTMLDFFMETPVPARSWTFVVRNIDGAPTRMDVRRGEVQDDESWKDVATYTATI